MFCSSSDEGSSTPAPSGFEPGGAVLLFDDRERLAFRLTCSLLHQFHPPGPKRTRTRRSRFDEHCADAAALLYPHGVTRRTIPLRAILGLEPCRLEWP